MKNMDIYDIAAVVVLILIVTSLILSHYKSQKGDPYEGCGSASIEYVNTGAPGCYNSGTEGGPKFGSSGGNGIYGGNTGGGAGPNPNNGVYYATMNVPTRLRVEMQLLSSFPGYKSDGSFQVPDTITIDGSRYVITKQESY